MKRHQQRNVARRRLAQAQDDALSAHFREVMDRIVGEIDPPPDAVVREYEFTISRDQETDDIIVRQSA